MNAFFTTLAHLFALVPGVAVLQSGLGAPPQYDRIFGGCIEAFGALTLALLWAARSRLRHWPGLRANGWAAGFGIAAVAFVVAYLFMYSTCVVKDAQYSGQTLYFPLWLSGRAARMVAMAGSRSAAIARFGPDAVRDALVGLTTAQSATTALLLFLYLGVFTSLTAAFGIIGFHGGKDLPKSDPGSAGSSPSP